MESFCVVRIVTGPLFYLSVIEHLIKDIMLIFQPPKNFELYKPPPPPPPLKRAKVVRLIVVIN